MGSQLIHGIINENEQRDSINHLSWNFHVKNIKQDHESIQIIKNTIINTKLTNIKLNKIIIIRLVLNNKSLQFIFTIL